MVLPNWMLRKIVGPWMGEETRNLNKIAQHGEHTFHYSQIVIATISQGWCDKTGIANVWGKIKTAYKIWIG